MFKEIVHSKQTGNTFTTSTIYTYTEMKQGIGYEGGIFVQRISHILKLMHFVTSHRLIMSNATQWMIPDKC